MNVIFRTDASFDIGTGHVMRCLTLAAALRRRGASCRFICRRLPGNLIQDIRLRGFEVIELPYVSSLFRGGEKGPAHAVWLGTDWKTDAEETKSAICGAVIDWLVVDHYALDARWEGVLGSCCNSLFVIDDLADRPHYCDMLLDHTLGRDQADYLPLVPSGCHLLCGSQYALLRPEFSSLRSYSLNRRARPVFRELLINMGGVDRDNMTGQILNMLRSCQLPTDCRVTVVMGTTAPWLQKVLEQVQQVPWPTRVLVGVSDMPQLMADSDLAIGAAGVTSWERCCLGLPTIMLILAQNQIKIARELKKTGGVRLIEPSEKTEVRLVEEVSQLIRNPKQLSFMTERAAKVLDGAGLHRVCEKFEVCNE